MDSGCDGLRTGDERVDVLYEKERRSIFDGQWKQQGLSQAVYTKRVQDAETRYSRLLLILMSSLKTAPTSAKAR